MYSVFFQFCIMKRSFEMLTSPLACQCHIFRLIRGNGMLRSSVPDEGLSERLFLHRSPLQSVSNHVYCVVCPRLVTCGLLHNVTATKTGVLHSMTTTSTPTLHHTYSQTQIRHRFNEPIQISHLSFHPNPIPKVKSKLFSSRWKCNSAVSWWARGDNRITPFRGTFQEPDVSGMCALLSKLLLVHDARSARPLTAYSSRIWARS